MSRPTTTHDADGDRHVGYLDALPPALLDAPLDYIFADHFRQRCLYGYLLGIAASRKIPRDEADAVMTFLTTDIALHHADEDEDLYPAVLRRARPEDGLEPILARLACDHLDSASAIETIAVALRRSRAAGTVRIGRHDAELLSAFARGEQRHLSIENGIVLVIARKRLSPHDLQGISRSMKARRGVET